MKFKILSITGIDGTPRNDGRYPQRINSTVEIYEEYIRVGSPFMWHYITDGQGNPKEGHLTTSRVENIEKPDNKLIITTRNSVYALERVGD